MDIYVTARGYIKEWGFSELRKSLESPSDSALVQTADRQHLRYIYIYNQIHFDTLNKCDKSIQNNNRNNTAT